MSATTEYADAIQPVVRMLVRQGRTSELRANDRIKLDEMASDLPVENVTWQHAWAAERLFELAHLDMPETYTPAAVQHVDVVLSELAGANWARKYDTAEDDQIERDHQTWV